MIKIVIHDDTLKPRRVVDKRAVDFHPGAWTFET